MKEKEPVLSQLEKLSLKALYQHCPLCGVFGKDYYCEECKLKWEEGMLYFSRPTTPPSSQGKKER